MAYRSRAYSTEVERKASALKHNPEKEQEAREWIESVLGRGSFPRGSFQEALADGILLCELINVLQPGSVKKIHTGSMKFKMMENISHFLKGCEEYGLTKTDLFQTVDLNEGRNIPQVINTMLALARTAQKPSSSKSTTSSSSRSYGSRRQDDHHIYGYDQQPHSYDQQTHGYVQQTHGYDQQTHGDDTHAYEYDQQQHDHDQQTHEDDQETQDSQQEAHD